MYLKYTSKKLNRLFAKKFDIQNDFNNKKITNEYQIKFLNSFKNTNEYIDIHLDSIGL